MNCVTATRFTFDYADNPPPLENWWGNADNPKRVRNIVVDLKVPKDVPEDRLEAIKRVVQRCPVHETLTHPPDADVDVIVKPH